ncbi:MAG TPA: hypothetical protein VF043_14680 [Ktedonobacteraceae bacterium]
MSEPSERSQRVLPNTTSIPLSPVFACSDGFSARAASAGADSSPTRSQALLVWPHPQDATPEPLKLA